MATETKTTTRKEWTPNEKQKMFMDALVKLGKASFREAKKYVLDTYNEAIATGSVNVLITKQYVGTEKAYFNVETTTIYKYPNGDITETKVSKKEETIYFLKSEQDRDTFEKSNLAEKGKKVETPKEEIFDFDEELLDEEGE